MTQWLVDSSSLFSLPSSLLPTPPFSFKRVLQVDPMDTKAMSSLALAYVDRGATEEAIHWFRRTVEVDPTSRAPLYNLAVVMTQSKRYAEALPLCSQLLAVGACVCAHTYVCMEYVHVHTYECTYVVCMCSWSSICVCSRCAHVCMYLCMQYMCTR